jgi:hypothetical protein
MSVYTRSKMTIRVCTLGCGCACACIALQQWTGRYWQLVPTPRATGSQSANEGLVDRRQSAIVDLRSTRTQPQSLTDRPRVRTLPLSHPYIHLSCLHTIAAISDACNPYEGSSSAGQQTRHGPLGAGQLLRIRHRRTWVSWLSSDPEWKFGIV